jgi:hypothetical protein
MKWIKCVVGMNTHCLKHDAKTYTDKKARLTNNFTQVPFSDESVAVLEGLMNSELQHTVSLDAGVGLFPQERTKASINNPIPLVLSEGYQTQSQVAHEGQVTHLNFIGNL